MQGDLIPRKILETWQQRWGSADFKLAGRCSAGRRHALKQTSDRPLLPATEWLCYRLADALDISVAPYRIVEMPDQSLAFASEVLPGKEIFLGPGNAGKLSDPTQPGALFALDVFVHNDDRHGKNYLWREVEESIQMYGIDFSRAELLALPRLDRPLLPPSCKTRRTAMKMHEIVPLDLSMVSGKLDSIRSLPDDRLAQWLTELPAAWLGDPERAEMNQWWAAGRHDRAGWLAYEVLKWNQ